LGLIALHDRAAELGELATLFHAAHDGPSERRKYRPLFVRELARRVVGYAQAPERESLLRHQRCARIKPNGRARQDQRVVLEPGVFEGVGDDEHVAAEDGVSAKRMLARRFGRTVHTDRGFEPLPLVINEADHGDRCSANIGRNAGEVVEFRF